MFEENFALLLLGLPLINEGAQLAAAYFQFSNTILKTIKHYIRSISSKSFEFYQSRHGGNRPSHFARGHERKPFKIVYIGSFLFLRKLKVRDIASKGKGFCQFTMSIKNTFDQNKQPLPKTILNSSTFAISGEDGINRYISSAEIALNLEGQLPYIGTNELIFTSAHLLTVLSVQKNPE